MKTVNKLNAYRVYLIMQGAHGLVFFTIVTVNLVYQATVVGLNPLQLVLVGTVLESSVLLFEVPTGVVADVYSRRLSVIIGFFLMGLGFMLAGSIPRFEIILLALATVLSAGSGLVLHVMKEWMNPADPFAVVNHPWQPLVLKIHLLSVPFLILALGMVLSGHAMEKVRARRRSGRRTGLAAMGLVVPMIVSGVVIQVLTSSSVIWMVAWLHLGSGLVYVGAYVLHVVLTPAGEPRSVAEKGRVLPRAGSDCPPLGKGTLARR